MSKGFEGFECMYGQASAEWENPNNNNGSPPTLQPFLFHVHAIDASHIRIHVTDFHSNTFEAVRSLPQLEDLRDDIGVGGSWSEFVDYLIASMKSVDVKLLLGSPIASSKLAGDNDTQFAKLIAQKSKGMPLISINLDKLTNIPANDAMSDLSLELFKAFTSKRDLVVKEQERCYHLTRSLSAEEV
ncbi:hypothetical protein GIB67_029769 [Kingdonia uniflora]|uniref:Uncharacterized protein n=1 Tax=Kingdonia uniflora TaxID=39325 RepID=A0A7J7NIQ2_9MAGN|nr:hypothetical protein GIB67_029769 [Kingdonia uniflora]